MRVVVVGGGEVGSYVADRLSREGHDVAVIEQDRRRVTEIEEALDVLVIHGVGSSPHALQRAGLDKADLLLAVTNSDDTNLVACQLAKQAGVPKTIARIEREELRTARRLHEAMGAEIVLDPDLQTAEEILELLEFRGASEVAELAGGEVLVLGAKLSERAPVVGRTLAEVAAEYEPEWEFLFGTITRGSDTIIPRGDVRLMAGDRVRVVCTRRARGDLAALLGIERSRVRRVFVLGGGRTGELLAERLVERGADVVIVERDGERARDLATRLPKCLVLEGDVTDADLLTEERVGDADAVVALTGEDDANVLACLFARSAGSRETVAMVHRLALLPLLDQVGIDAALTSRTAFANAVLRYVRGDVAAVATFLEGEAEVLEFEVKEGSEADGAAIAELRLPLDVLIGAIVRDGKARIGRGRSVLRSRDHVVVFAKPHAVPSVRRCFG